MQQGGEKQQDFVGINWGSSNFRAYRISAAGDLIDSFAEPAGIAGLDRLGIVRQIERVVTRWPDCPSIYAAGMIGSNIGWTEVPYVVCPAGLDDIAAAMTQSNLGGTSIAIVPGLACQREDDGGLDVLRGEETELYGLAAIDGLCNCIIALPGTHTKWVRVQDGRIVDFLTSMSGEIYDRLTAHGLLASIVAGEAHAGDVFRQAVDRAVESRRGLASALFGVRANVLRGALARTDSASSLRGLLIGSDITDATALYPALKQAVVPLIGNGPLGRLYAAALAVRGIESRMIDAERAGVAGFAALHLTRIGSDRAHQPQKAELPRAASAGHG